MYETLKGIFSNTEESSRWRIFNPKGLGYRYLWIEKLVGFSGPEELIFFPPKCMDFGVIYRMYR